MEQISTRNDRIVQRESSLSRLSWALGRARGAVLSGGRHHSQAFIDRRKHALASVSFELRGFGWKKMSKADLSVLLIASDDRTPSSSPSTSHPARQMPLDHAGAKPVRHGDRDVLHDAGYEPLHQLVGAPTEARRFCAWRSVLRRPWANSTSAASFTGPQTGQHPGNVTTGEARLTGLVLHLAFLRSTGCRAA